jgi:hypothetical protein
MSLSKITDEQRQELTLLLLYLNSWEEKEPVRRAWKSHDFGTLDALIEQDFISGSHTSKSIYFSKAGEEKALEILQKYFKQP